MLDDHICLPILQSIVLLLFLVYAIQGDSFSNMANILNHDENSPLVFLQTAMMLNSVLTKFSVKWHKVLTTVMTVVEFLSGEGEIQ